jgi:RHS repeat-associated protein
MKRKSISQTSFFSPRTLTSLVLIAVSSVVLLLGVYLGAAETLSPKRNAIQGYTLEGKPILREQQPTSIPQPLTPECENSWSLNSSLYWAVVADWDFHLQTPNAYIYYGNRSADGFTLDRDANPACAATPLPPEHITGMGQCGTYTLYSNLYSTCGGSPPITFSATVTALKTISINGTAYNPGQTFQPQDGIAFTVAAPSPTPAPLPIGDAGAPAAQFYDTTEEPTSGGPVDLATLAETFSHTLLSVSGARPLEFTISYNSQLTAGNRYVTGQGWTLYTPGDVGHWTHNFEGQATLVAGTPNQVNLLVAHRRWAFLQNGSSYQIVGHASPYDSLVGHTDGSYTLKTKDQSTYTFSGSALYLTRVTNPHGQAIVIVRNSSGDITTLREPVSGKSLSFTYGTTGNSAGRITHVTSAGRSASLAYNNSGMLTQITEANGGITSFTYDSARHLLTETDAHGNILTNNTYNAAHGYVMTQVDGRGHQYSYSFSTGTNTTRVTVRDRNSHQSTSVFDQNHNLISFTSPLNETTRYTYDSNRNLRSKTDPLGNTTSYSYNARGDVTRITDALGKTTVMTYDGRHNLLSVTNPDNHTSTFTYDARNNLLTATDALGHQVVRTYNANSLLLSQTNPNGGVSPNTYTSGLLTSRMDAAGNTETMAYDAIGNLTRRTDPTGAATRYHYGTLRELLEIDDADGNSVVNTYDWRLRKSTVTDPSGAVTHYAYDGNNNIVSTTDALNQTTTFGYDNEDRPTHVTDPLGHTSSRSYDADGRLIRTTNAAGNTTSYGYDGANNLLTVTDGLSHTVVTNSYDARNQLVTSTDALGHTSRRTYDNARLLASTHDPLGRITSFVHDALGRTTAVYAPLSTVTSQRFDADGNRTAIINANNESTHFTFDIADRLTRTTTATGKATAYGYNNRSLTSLLTLPSGAHTSLTYDALGRLSTAVDPVGTITYSYDNNGRVIRTAQTISGTTKTIRRQYDLLGRLTQFTDAAGKVLRYTYDRAGNLTTLTYPDQKHVTYHYDTARRLTSVTDWATRVTSYTYDADSRVTTITRPDQSVETFTYDAAGQITRSNDVAPGSNLLHNILYTFDPNGKITRENITPAPGIYHPAALTFTVDADNRLATINQHAAVYDNNGNLTHATIPGSTISTLVYDARNRLVQAGGLTYTYDAENRRTSVASTAGTTSYVINPNAGLDQILVKTAPNGTVTRYVYGLGLIGEETGSTFTTYHYDHRGSTTALTRINGSVIQRFSYGPNGEPVGFNPATAPTQFLFGGRYGVSTDTNGLCYMRARYYLPAISRFINQDTVLGNVELGISLNRFAYANGDPINKNDPFGLAAEPLDKVGTALELAGEFGELLKHYGLTAITSAGKLVESTVGANQYVSRYNLPLEAYGTSFHIINEGYGLYKVWDAYSTGAANADQIQTEFIVDSGVNTARLGLAYAAGATVGFGVGLAYADYKLLKHDYQVLDSNYGGHWKDLGTDVYYSLIGIGLVSPPNISLPNSGN